MVFFFLKALYKLDLHIDNSKYLLIRYAGRQDEVNVLLLAL